ncbi:hypothetical protein ACLOJK_038557 [Asimina triloba]
MVKSSLHVHRLQYTAGALVRCSIFFLMTAGDESSGEAIGKDGHHDEIPDLAAASSSMPPASRPFFSDPDEAAPIVASSSPSSAVRRPAQIQPSEHHSSRRPPKSRRPPTHLRRRAAPSDDAVQQFLWPPQIQTSINRAASHDPTLHHSKDRRPTWQRADLAVRCSEHQRSSFRSHQHLPADPAATNGSRRTVDDPEHHEQNPSVAMPFSSQRSVGSLIRFANPGQQLIACPKPGSMAHQKQIDVHPASRLQPRSVRQQHTRPAISVCPTSRPASAAGAPEPNPKRILVRVQGSGSRPHPSRNSVGATGGHANTSAIERVARKYRIISALYYK